MTSSNMSMLQNEMDTLKNSTKSVIATLISGTNKSSISNTLYGGQFMSVQISSNITSMQETAKNNGLSTLDLTNCLSKLKEKYNIPEDSKLVIEKWDLNANIVNVSNIDRTLASDYLSFNVFSSDLNTKLDVSICFNTTIPIQIPLKAPENLNLTFYRKMQNQTVDIFDPGNIAFTSRCGAVVDPDNNADTSMNYRRSNYYQNLSLVCQGAQCNYNGIDSDDYVNCNCTNVKEDTEINNDFKDLILGAVSNFNFDVVSCIEKAFCYVLYF
jgi:hypothetical protein